MGKNNETVIEVHDLCFSYTKTPFLKDINFSVNRGEIFGFLGPSGAEKRTQKKVLTGLCTNYQGMARVLNIDSNKHGKDFYENIGVDFEFPSLFEKLTAIPICTRSPVSGSSGVTVPPPPPLEPV